MAIDWAVLGIVIAVPLCLFLLALFCPLPERREQPSAAVETGLCRCRCNRCCGTGGALVGSIEYPDPEYLLYRVGDSAVFVVSGEPLWHLEEAWMDWEILESVGC